MVYGTNLADRATGHQVLDGVVVLLALILNPRAARKRNNEERSAGASVHQGAGVSVNHGGSLQITQITEIVKQDVPSSNAPRTDYQEVLSV